MSIRPQRTARTAFRIAPELLDRARIAAAEKDLSLSGWLVNAVQTALLGKGARKLNFGLTEASEIDRSGWSLESLQADMQMRKERLHDARLTATQARMAVEQAQKEYELAERAVFNHK